MNAKNPDFVITEHVFHAGAGSELACRDFIRDNREAVYEVSQGVDRITVLLSVRYNPESVVFATATYPK
jgi:hypothetical protein